MNHDSRTRLRLPLFWIATLCVTLTSYAGPVVVAGDSVLRHDIQLLADRGVIRGPVSTWPLAWGPILEDIRDYQSVESSAEVIAAITRVQKRAAWETRQHELSFSGGASAAEKPMRMRGYENTPRGNGEIAGGLSYTGSRANVMLNVQAIDDPGDDTVIRGDGSMLGVALGNWTASINTLERWWGPGWDGSIILGNNARPLASVSLDRNFTDPFRSRWLSWLGPWDLSVTMGQLEEDRHVPNAWLFGMRFAFRPLQSLEIGLSRTAQWCGDGRSCDLATFGDLLLGRDNRGDDGLSIETEPGNQLAGVDIRWSGTLLGVHGSVYGQFIGEDEAGGFPSRYLGQLGLDAHGAWGDRWSWRAYGEFAGTSCQFHEATEIFNCGYNHSVYLTGYRYRGRSLGHAADNDARVVSAGLTAVDINEVQWRVNLRTGDLNRGGDPDFRNTLTATPQEFASIDISHSRAFNFGVIEVGLGLERMQEPGAEATSNARYYAQWRSAW